MGAGLFSSINGAQKRYAKIKANPLLLKKYRNSKNKSQKKHRKHTNAKRSVYYKEMREAAKSLGRCTKCFQEKENLKYKMCSKCREKLRTYSKIRRFR